MAYSRRSSDGERSPVLVQQNSDSSQISLSQFYIRYFNLAVIVAYLWFAGEVAPGFLSFEMVLVLAGLYFIGNTVLLLAAVYRSAMLPAESFFWLDCSVIMLGIAHDPFATLPVQLLLLETLVDTGLRNGFASYRRGLFVVSMALAGGFGLRTLFGPGVELPAVVLMLIMAALAVYMYQLLRRSDKYLNDLYRLSRHDELTGLSNRRALYDKGRQLCTGLGRGQRAVLMFADLDNLKEINDMHGHAAGDTAIQAIGRAISECVRSGDIAARYAGDEFIAIFVGADIVEARRIAERIQDTAAETGLRVSDLKVSLSMGLAEVTGPNANFDIAIQRADAALYRAKQKQGKAAIAIDMQAG